MSSLVSWLLTLALPAVIAAAAVLAVLDDWRVRLAALAVLYSAAALLVTQLVVRDVAAARLVAGLLVTVILGLTMWQVSFRRPEAGQARSAGWRHLELPTGFAFRLIAALMMLVVAAYLAEQPRLVLPGLRGQPALNTASYMLMALGLLKLGLSEEPMHSGMALLTLLTGFELFYVAVEPSLAIVALLAAVHFAIAVAVSYLTVVQYAGSSEEAVVG